MDAARRLAAQASAAISAWYSAELYTRLLQLYALAAPGSSREFLIESGRRSAQRIIELGIYSQLDGRTEDSWENLIGRILVSLSGAFFSFGSWEWEGMDGEGFSILVRDAAPMSEELMLRTSGFIEQLGARAAGGEVALTHEREDDGETVRFCAHRIQ